MAEVFRVCASAASGFQLQALDLRISTSVSGYWAKFQAYNFRVRGSEFRLRCLGFMDEGLGYWEYGLRHSVSGLGCRVRVLRSGFGVSDLCFTVLEYRV